MIAAALSIRIMKSVSIGAILTACAIAASCALVLDKLPATLLLTLCGSSSFCRRLVPFSLGVPWVPFPSGGFSPLPLHVCFLVPRYPRSHRLSLFLLPAQSQRSIGCHHALFHAVVLAGWKRSQVCLKALEGAWHGSQNFSESMSSALPAGPLASLHTSELMHTPQT